MHPTADDRRDDRAGQNAAMGEDSRSGEREPDIDDIVSDCGVMALFSRLVTAGDISADAGELLTREWANCVDAARDGAPGERDYWSLRLARDLARALGNHAVCADPELEFTLRLLEEALVTGFVARL
jgi:hypothetical protein